MAEIWWKRRRTDRSIYWVLADDGRGYYTREDESYEKRHPAEIISARAMDPGYFGSRQDYDHCA